MANRLALFIAAIVVGLGALIAHPWVEDGSYNPGGQVGLLKMAIGAAVVVYVIIRGLGWVFTGK
jgi:hypothetical protein